LWRRLCEALEQCARLSLRFKLRDEQAGNQSSVKINNLVGLPAYRPDKLMPNLTFRIKNLKFLKLGGSLITEKARPHTLRVDVLARLAAEIATACRDDPELILLLGHGSGSFGHVPAQRYGTRQGVHTRQDWQGFVEVWREAAALNRLVIEALEAVGLPAVAFPPSAGVTAAGGRLAAWDVEPLRLALLNGLLPVVYGDVIFDTQQGGTIFSTEDLFAYLAVKFQPGSLLLAGLEAGVWADFPRCTRLVDVINPQNLVEVAPGISGSAATDVTGGMASKVQQSLELVQHVPGLQVRIFSGEAAGNLQRALAGQAVGTLIHA
jgi:isopentenyl phosphate kinase